MHKRFFFAVFFSFFFCLILSGCNRFFVENKIKHLHVGQSKEEILRIMGCPDWEASGRNTIEYYYRKYNKTLQIDFDSKSKLVNYQLIDADSFPESPVKHLFNKPNEGRHKNP